MMQRAFKTRPLAKLLWQVRMCSDCDNYSHHHIGNIYHFFQHHKERSFKWFQRFQLPSFVLLLFDLSAPLVACTVGQRLPQHQPPQLPQVTASEGQVCHESEICCDISGFTLLSRPATEHNFVNLNLYATDSWRTVE